MTRNLDNTLLSIIIPVYNEEKNIPILLDRFSNILTGLIRFEVIFVDDGSTDQTLDIIKQSCGIGDNVYYISFTRNFGHQKALKAGLDLCGGDLIVSLDGDLQHPPELIPQMLKRWQEGYDIVYTCRKDAQDTGNFKRISSSLFYWFMNKISKLNLKPGVADFRLINKKALESIKKYEETDLFLRGIIAGLGFKQAQLEYTPAQRLYGTTKYSFRKMISLALSGITGFSVFPLRVLTSIGLIFAFLSFIYGLYALGVRFYSDYAVPGWTSMMAGIYFLGGLQLAAIGICGEYIGKIFLEVKHRPQYLIAESFLPGDCDQKEDIWNT